MGTVQLVTGYAGVAHVSSADVRAYNAGVVGAGRYVFNEGSKFAYTLVSNNLITIADGDLLNQGAQCRIRKNDTVNCTIENGLAGTKRNDIIVMRYSKDTTTAVESATLVVIKGTSGSTATDPSYTVGNILNGDNVDDFPLYRVRLNGLSVEGIDTLFTTITNLTELSETVSENATEFDDFKTSIDTAKITENVALSSLKGINVLVLGDSVSDTSLYTNCWVKNFTEAVTTAGGTVTNKSLQGRTITDYTGSGSNTLNSILSTITGTFDYIFLFMGVNDYFNQVTIGSIGDTATTTLCGALGQFNNWVNTNQTNAKVMCVTPLKTNKSGFTGTIVLQFYVTAICSMAIWNGWQIVDAHSFAPKINPYVNASWQIDGIHPTDSYAAFLSKYILQNLISGKSSVGTNSNVSIGVLDVTGTSSKVTAYINANGGISFTVSNFTVTSTGNIKICDLPSYIATSKQIFGAGYINAANGASMCVALATVGNAIYVVVPTDPGYVGTLYGSLTGGYVQYCINHVM
ncbi:MAG TPA: SGNH/GDSL hydrolase family protein [Bacteroidales bacterium]|nr:SGNH/GDSL hydrolase family protein [Bacteroidales bacterium]